MIHGNVKCECDLIARFDINGVCSSTGGTLVTSQIVRGEIYESLWSESGVHVGIPTK